MSVEEVLDVGDVGAGGAAVNKVHSYSYTTALSFVYSNVTAHKHNKYNLLNLTKSYM